MDIISLGKATQAMNQIKELSESIVAPQAESHFPTVDARLDWLEAQAAKAKAISSKSVDLSSGMFNGAEYSSGALRLKKAGEIIGEGYGPSWDVVNQTIFAFGNSITFDAGVDQKKRIEKVWINGSTYNWNGMSYNLQSFKLYGSNDNENFDLLYSGNQNASASYDHVFVNENYYRYYKMADMIGYSGLTYRIALRSVKMYERAIANTYLSKGTWESEILDLGEGWLSTLETIRQVVGIQGLIATPPMTAISNEVGTIIASSSYFGNAALIEAFDQVESAMGWQGAGTTNQWLGFRFTKPIVINEYRMVTTRNDQMHRAPKSWRFEASNDGTNWIVLDEQENQTGWAYLVSRDFKVDNSTAYTHYRVYCFNNNGGSSYTNIGELKLIEGKGEVDIQVAGSEDGINFDSYQPITTMPQTKFVKFKASISAGAAQGETTSFDFNQSSDQNKFTLNDQTIADGKLQLKTSYSETMNQESVTEGGAIYSAIIDKTAFKSIEKVSVK
ncbi:discoidin domain-containing protein (plasmid) [Paenibacillus urinalis]|uniref:Discoidin domain-containing protein n=1 Tax=Paenibacillus urinalis TaxID=521520 RepID=A0ABY7XK01_9BACL|nr:discoidin domain-containing protein [Paenibacillus urinalis]WDI05111.1 discoidin domain-containing protein [Paenibacillus urinalis]